MERIYRLEFNEKQQQFHLDNFTHEENTHGWVTIMGECTDLQFHILESFVNRVESKRLTKDYIVRCVKELKGFIDNLAEYNLHIAHT